MGGSKPAPPEESEFVTFKSEQPPSPTPDVRILHLNDVYHLDPASAEPVGGIARFQTAVNEYRADERFRGQSELVTLFSGDVFNPSLESSVTKGSHMVPILNGIGINCACVGNHDLDFGVEQYQHLTAQCKFPWMLANVFDPSLGDGVPIGNSKKTHMITTSNGIKIGLLGLGEREWLDTVNAMPPDIIYKSATATAKELIPRLRQQGADMVIVLSHAREPNDNKLAENLNGEVDLILGGHDHFYSHSFINGTHVLRSGSDFKQLSYLEARRRPGAKGKWDFNIWRKDIVSSIREDQATLDLVEKLTAKLKQSLQKPVGWTAAPLDARFTTVRLKESNMGNFICDIMRHYYRADCVIMAAGTIRGDQVYTPGPIRVKDITDCFPFEDPVVVIKVTGKDIVEALENGVSLYPALEGRFPQVSNISFQFDPSKPAGSRVLSTEIGGTAVDMDKVYVLCTRGYMARGKDGFKSLLIESEGGTAEEVVDEENGILISTMLRQYFMALKVMGKWSTWGSSMQSHWDNVVSCVDSSHPHHQPSPTTDRKEPRWDNGGQPQPEGWENWTADKLRERKAAVKPLDDGHGPEEEDASHQYENLGAIDRELGIARKVFRKWCRLAGIEEKLCDELKEGEYEVEWTKAIAPRLEGRIRCTEPAKA